MVADLWATAASSAMSPTPPRDDESDDDPLGSLLASRKASSEDDFASNLAKSFEAYLATADAPQPRDSPSRNCPNAEWKANMRSLRKLESIFSNPPLGGVEDTPPPPPVPHASPASLASYGDVMSPIVAVAYGQAPPPQMSLMGRTPPLACVDPVDHAVARVAGVSPPTGGFASPNLPRAPVPHPYGYHAHGHGPPRVPVSPCALGAGIHPTNYGGHAPHNARGVGGVGEVTGYAISPAMGEHGAGGDYDVANLRPPTSSGSTAPRRPRMEVTRQRPCTHNQWERISKKKNSISLRCRLCKTCWKTKLEFFSKCTAFYAGQCTEGDNCEHPHIYSKAAEKHQLLKKQGGDDDDDDGDGPPADDTSTQPDPPSQ